MAYYKITKEQLTYLKKRDKELKKLIEKYGVIEREVETDIFKALVYNIISQQISTKAANTIKARLIKYLDDITPKVVNDVSSEVLRSVGLSLRKATYIKEIANRVLNGDLVFDDLRHLEDDEVIKELIKLPGIGVWTAEMLLLFTLGRENVMSYHDLGIIRGLKRLYNKEQLSKEEFLEIKKSFTPYASIASLYIWKLASEN